MKTKQLFISLLSLAIILAGITLADAAGVWKNPKVAPPGENVDAPVNVGAIAQDKAGVLRVTGFRSFFDAIIDTKLQVGTTATMPSNLKLLTDGKVGAEAYCDRQGNNCVTSSGIPVSSSSSNTTGGDSTTALDCSVSGPNAFDSGFVNLAPGALITIPFGKDLGADAIMYVEYKNTGGPASTGGSPYTDIPSNSVNNWGTASYGVWWAQKTSTAVKFQRSTSEDASDQVRVVVKKRDC
jgi:hypothetical protein